MRMMTLGMVLGLILTEQAYAGPYYNAPDSGPEEEMAEFEDLLNEARKFIIEMLDSWESNPEAAVEFKGAAVDRLSMAVEVLQSVDELEFAELFVSPDFLKSEMQVAAYSDIGPVLEPLDLVEPKTYGDIINSTIQLTQRFRDVIAEVEIVPFPEGWEQSRMVIEADANMVLVGSVFSALAQTASQ